MRDFIPRLRVTERMSKYEQERGICMLKGKNDVLVGLYCVVCQTLTIFC